MFAFAGVCLSGCIRMKAGRDVQPAIDMPLWGQVFCCFYPGHKVQGAGLNSARLLAILPSHTFVSALSCEIH